MIQDIARTYLSYRKDNDRPVQISFYGGNFLGLLPRQLTGLLEAASACVTNGMADTIRFSTRPDTVTPETLSIVKQFPVSTIELGVQSMNNKVLRLSARGHTANDIVGAVSLLRENTYEIGLQMMVGLPGDTPGSLRETAEKIAGLKPDFTRIYPCVVLKNSPLQRLMKAGSYTPLTLERAVALTKQVFLIFKRHNIKVIRMGLQASEDLDNGSSIAAGPYHPAFGHHVFSEIFYDAIKKALSAKPGDCKDIEIRVHPKNESKLRGIKNHNMNRLKNDFNPLNISVSIDETLDLHTVVAGGSTIIIP